MVGKSKQHELKTAGHITFTIRKQKDKTVVQERGQLTIKMGLLTSVNTSKACLEVHLQMALDSVKMTINTNHHKFNSSNTQAYWPDNLAQWVS